MHPSDATPHPVLTRTLWQWLTVGLLATAWFPEARGPVHLLGSLPFWLLLAPASGLLVLYRHRAMTLCLRRHNRAAC